MSHVDPSGDALPTKLVFVMHITLHLLHTLAERIRHLVGCHSELARGLKGLARDNIRRVASLKVATDVKSSSLECTSSKLPTCYSGPSVHMQERVEVGIGIILWAFPVVNSVS